jgi:hypothetical protein
VIRHTLPPRSRNRRSQRYRPPTASRGPSLKRQAHSYTRHQAVSRLIRDNLGLNRAESL